MQHNPIEKPEILSMSKSEAEELSDLSSLCIEKPIVFLDIESTGLDIVNDRIVEISLYKVFPDGKTNGLVAHTYRFNPGVMMDEKNMSIHGITNEEVAGEPVFAEKAEEIFSILNNCDLAGYNHIRFDVPLLIQEFHNFGINFPIENVRLIDVQVIFHKLHPRTLVAAFETYTRKQMKEAHSASIDTLATLMVFKKQYETHFSGKSLTQVEDFIKEGNKVADLVGKLVYNEQGDICFNFGKYYNVPVKNCLDYAQYLLQQGWMPFVTEKVLQKIINENDDGWD